MHRSAHTSTPQALPHVFVLAISLVANAGCSNDGKLSDVLAPGDAAPPADATLPDGNTPPEIGLEAERSCSQYPATSRTDSNGTTWYWWYLHWQSASNDLAGFCASYGASASMVVEVGIPQNPSPQTTLPICTNDEIWNGGSRACAVADSYRFEAPCGAGELLFELPSQNGFDGFYHFESAQLPALPRHLITQDVHCSRDLYVTAPAPGPLVLDAGIDSSDGGVCKSIYTSPGCGGATKPDCWQPNGEPIPAIGIFYCNCAGKTVMGSVVGSDEPYQFKGCCPGDSGFGPMSGYSCPADGGIPFITPLDASPDSPTSIDVLEQG
jgi:hypothetical protein